MTPTLCYLRSGNNRPDLCIQRERQDELEVLTLSENQCDELLIRLVYYIVRTRKDANREA